MSKKQKQEAPKIDPVQQERLDKLQGILKNDIVPFIKSLDKSAYDVEMMTQVFSSAIQGAAVSYVSKKQLGELDIAGNLNPEHEDHKAWLSLIDKLGHLSVSDAQLLAQKLAQLVQFSVAERSKDVKIQDVKIIGLE